MSAPPRTTTFGRCLGLLGLMAAGALQNGCFVGIVVNEDETNVLVYESTGQRQCEPASSNAQQSARRLTDAGVAVRDSSCAILTNLAFPAVCGAPSGQLYVHEIDERGIAAAQRTGFTLVTTLRLGNGDAGYAMVSCPAMP
jgi:hypothetical protein